MSGKANAPGGVMLGARWEDPCQDDRTAKARDAGLIDYAEVNYPVAFGWTPDRLEMPVLVHTSSNPICSFHGVSRKIASMIKQGADQVESPWIGEHLTWLGAEGSGSLGYQINPLFTREFKDIAVANVESLAAFYGRPVALELGPIYLGATEYESEIHFLRDVAIESDAQVIVDVTHWQIANRNLGRAADYGLDVFPEDRVVELHIAGMRQGSDDRHWHDAHYLLPPEEVYELTADMARRLPHLRAITFEHQADGPEEDFFEALERLNQMLGDARPQ